MNTSVRNGLFVGVAVLFILGLFVWFFDNKNIRKEAVVIEKTDRGQLIKNNTMNYSSIIPNDWVIETRETGNISAIGDISNGNYCKIETYILSEMESVGSLDDWVSRDESDAKKDSQIYSYNIEKLKIDGLDARKLVIHSKELGNSKAIILKKDVRIMQFVLYSPEEKIVECEKVFGNYLNTIDFIKDEV